MELKPRKEKNEVLYPTIKEVPKSNHMKEILVRADDLGYSEAVNYGLAKTLREGIIRSVGIMVNMPYTKHGYELIKDLDVCKGLHTNICVGRPLCNPADVKSICQ